MKVKQATSYALHATMYMVRHITQLPITVTDIAKAQGIPPGYLAKIFQQLTKAGIVKAAKDRRKGYVFAKKPEDISLLELFEIIEGGPVFNDCFMRHCQCNETVRDCHMFAMWNDATKQINSFLSETNLVTAAWNHPEHTFPEKVKSTSRQQQ